MKEMICCGTLMPNFSYHKIKITDKRVPHFYCNKCGKHYWKNRWYTMEEWFFYINERTYKEELHERFSK